MSGVRHFINAMQSHSGEHLLAVRLYVILGKKELSFTRISVVGGRNSATDEDVS